MVRKDSKKIYPEISLQKLVTRMRCNDGSLVPIRVPDVDVLHLEPRVEGEAALEGELTRDLLVPAEAEVGVAPGDQVDVVQVGGAQPALQRHVRKGDGVGDGEGVLTVPRGAPESRKRVGIYLR